MRPAIFRTTASRLSIAGRRWNKLSSRISGFHGGDMDRGELVEGIERRARRGNGDLQRF